MMRSPAQRRAYIETARRSQPLAELARKAGKARRRLRGPADERTDLLFGQCWRNLCAVRESFEEIFLVTSCSLCGRFAPAAEAVAHLPRCAANRVDDGPWPGWHAAGGAPRRCETAA